MLNSRKRAVEMTGGGKRGKPKPGFPRFPPPLEIAPRFPHSHNPDDDSPVPKSKPKTRKEPQLRRKPQPPSSGSSFDEKMLKGSEPVAGNSLPLAFGRTTEGCVSACHTAIQGLRVDPEQTSKRGFIDQPAGESCFKSSPSFVYSFPSGAPRTESALEVNSGRVPVMVRSGRDAHTVQEALEGDASARRLN